MSQDRRIRRTQKLLGEALIAVALEKGYKNITIQDVTERADIGYRTFFRHYNGLDELYLDLTRERLDELYEVLDLPKADKDIAGSIALFRNAGETIFRHIQENQENFCLLLLDDSLRFILEPVIKMAREKTEISFSSLSEKNISIPIAANHIIASSFALIRWWLENDMPHPPERMGEIFADLIILPTWKALTNQ